MSSLPLVVITAAVTFVEPQSAPAGKGPATAQERAVRKVLDGNRAAYEPCVEVAREEAPLGQEVASLKKDVEKAQAEPPRSREEAEQNFKRAEEFSAAVIKHTDLFLRLNRCQADFLAQAKPKLKTTGASEKSIGDIYAKWKEDQMQASSAPARTEP